MQILDSCSQLFAEHSLGGVHLHVLVVLAAVTWIRWIPAVVQKRSGTAALGARTCVIQLCDEGTSLCFCRNMSAVCR